MYCRNCGERLDDDALFCPKCGKRTSSKLESAEARVKDISKKVTGYAKESFKDVIPEKSKYGGQKTLILLSKAQGASGILLGCLAIVFGIMAIVLETEYPFLEGNGLPTAAMIFYVLTLAAGLAFAAVSFIIFFKARKTGGTGSNNLTYVVLGSIDVLLSLMAVNVVRFANAIIKGMNGEDYNVLGTFMKAVIYGGGLPASLKFSTVMAGILIVTGVISAGLAAYNLRNRNNK